MIILFFSLLYCILEDSLLKKVNSERKGLGLSPLKYNQEVTKIASKHAKYLCNERLLTYNYYNTTIYKYIKMKYPMFENISENIARHQSDDINAVFRQWMASPDHKSRIIGDYEYLGIGTCKDKNEKRYWVQLFANKVKRDAMDILNMQRNRQNYILILPSKKNVKNVLEKLENTEDPDEKSNSLSSDSDVQRETKENKKEQVLRKNPKKNPDDDNFREINPDDYSQEDRDENNNEENYLRKNPKYIFDLLRDNEKYRDKFNTDGGIKKDTEKKNKMFPREDDEDKKIHMNYNIQSIFGKLCEEYRNCKPGEMVRPREIVPVDGYNSKKEEKEPEYSMMKERKSEDGAENMVVTVTKTNTMYTTARISQEKRYENILKKIETLMDKIGKQDNEETLPPNISPEKKNSDSNKHTNSIKDTKANTIPEKSNQKKDNTPPSIKKEISINLSTPILNDILLKLFKILNSKISGGNETMRKKQTTDDEKPTTKNGKKIVETGEDRGPKKEQERNKDEKTEEQKKDLNDGNENRKIIEKTVREIVDRSYKDKLNIKKNDIVNEILEQLEGKNVNNKLYKKKDLDTSKNKDNENSDGSNQNKNNINRINTVFEKNGMKIHLHID